MEGRPPRPPAPVSIPPPNAAPSSSSSGRGPIDWLRWGEATADERGGLLMINGAAAGGQGIDHLRLSRIILGVSIAALAVALVISTTVGAISFRRSSPEVNRGGFGVGGGVGAVQSTSTSSSGGSSSNTGAYKDPAISSPTTPNPNVTEPGCPAIGPPPPGRRYIQIHNNCKETIWPGVLPPGAGIPDDRNWTWSAGACKVLEVASSQPSLRVWARTQCDSSYHCITGSCQVDGSGGCQSAGEAPCSLWEATLQDHCTMTPAVGMGPDFYDQSLVDGFNVPLMVKVSGGYNVGQVPKDFSCQQPVSNSFNPESCPYELRTYSDQIPGTNLPVEGLNGVNQVTSKCFTTPLADGCADKVVGCRSLCKAMDQGWIGYYIDHVQGPEDVVNPVLTRPTGERIRWSDQFLQGKTECGGSLCKDSPAWGAFRGSIYAGNGLMKSLVCCDSGFRCSPYQPNNVPGGCPYETACPTLGAADPTSRFHTQMARDVKSYPQADEQIRKSSSLPDWPMPTRGGNYAKIYKDSSPTAYSWQYNDATSTYVCCGKQGEPGPSYILTLCPS